ncbi:MAG: transporter substrate-binding domain-containing protein [Alphaproteobacteria bacterium]|nr:transporter substrate-binding domain-containing protein [Alphaproteobacteria bacterium]
MKFAKLALVASAVLVLGLAATDASAQMRKVKIATEGAYAPWNFVNSQGKLEGFELELGAELCKRAKFDCEFVAQDWDGIIPSLQAKKYDAIMAGMNITPRRLETINFTTAYAAGAHGFMVLKSSPLAKMPGGEYNLTKDLAAAEKAINELKPMLKGKILGVQGSTTNLAWAEKYFKDVAEIREYKTTEQHDLDLAAGRLDATVGAHSAAKATMETATGKDMMIAGPGFSGGMLGLGVAVGLRKEDADLKTAFDDAVKSAIDDGTIKKLSEKWFKVDMTPKS